jgi:hypothetical protein
MRYFGSNPFASFSLTAKQYTIVFVETQDLLNLQRSDCARAQWNPERLRGVKLQARFAIAGFEAFAFWHIGILDVLTKISLFSFQKAV